MKRELKLEKNFCCERFCLKLNRNLRLKILTVADVWICQMFDLEVVKCSYLLWITYSSTLSLFLICVWMTCVAHCWLHFGFVFSSPYFNLYACNSSISLMYSRVVVAGRRPSFLRQAKKSCSSETLNQLLNLLFCSSVFLVVKWNEHPISSFLMNITDCPQKHSTRSSTSACIL